MIHAYHSQMRLFHASFPASYISAILATGEPDQDLNVRKTRGYEMLEPSDRAAFMDVLVALFRKFEAGEVKTGFSWGEFPDNPVKNVVCPSIPFFFLDVWLMIASRASANAGRDCCFTVPEIVTRTIAWAAEDGTVEK